jgi:hypothetical protein
MAVDAMLHESEKVRLLLAHENLGTLLERFPPKACPGLDPGWTGSREENASN